VYTEAMDSTVNLDNARRSNFDPDEIEEEVRDKRLRKKMNEAFKDFAAKVSQSVIYLYTACSIELMIIAMTAHTIDQNC
jgi:nucleosome binding factor SPN SPT16 subunit